jgi:hypothetical protein
MGFSVLVRNVTVYPGLDTSEVFHTQVMFYIAKNKYTKNKSAFIDTEDSMRSEGFVNMCLTNILL